jgi:alpha-1,2-glucosyltransferase
MLLALAYFALHVCIALVTTHLQPAPYMDEYFHVNLACRILRDPFAQDPLVTTPPGLYYMTLPLTGFSCDVFRLRLTSALFHAVGLHLLVLLFEQTHSPHPRLAALAAITFPPGFFTAQLYYTDACALACVLLALLTSRDRPATSFVASTLAVFCRQTNAVWVAFILGRVVVLECQSAAGSKQLWTRDPRIWLGKLDWRRLARLCAGHVVSLGLLLGYLLARGGTLALGDKSHHQVTPHFAQLCYLCALALLSSPVGMGFLHSPTITLRTMRRKTPAWALALLLLLATTAVGGFSVTHPFLLADNRHYTFYVWARFFRRHWFAKYALVPAYVAGAALAWDALDASLESLGFVLACALCLVPLPLVEPRYFIVPLAVLGVLVSKRLHTRRVLCSCVALHALLNLAAALMFWLRPFVWADGQVARFMW